MKIFKNKLKNNSKSELLEKIGNRIYYGPFSGLKIPEKAVNFLSVTELLGLYESCLHSKIGELINKEINNIILVGGNNGYYAAGISCIFNPDSIIIYETEKFFHNIIESWFEVNNLNNSIILGEATYSEFKKVNTKIDLVFMDCEGFEVELLNPEDFYWQQKTDILIEIHPFYVDNLVSILTKRFSKSHNIEIIYDNFSEDSMMEKILDGFEINIKYNKHPNHRWIIEKGLKVYTSGVFMFLTQK